MLFFIKQIEMIEITLISVVCVALLVAKATTMINAEIDAPFPTGKDEQVSEEEVEAHLNGLLARLPLFNYILGSEEAPVTIADIERRGYLPENYVSRLSWWHNSPHHKEGWGYNHIVMMLTLLVTFVEALGFASHWIKGRIEEMTLAILWHDIGMASTLKPKTMANPDGEGRVPKLYNGEPETTAPLHVKEALRLLDEQKDRWPNSTIRFRTVRDLVASHMQSHDIWGTGPGAESMKSKLEKVEEFKSDILDVVRKMDGRNGLINLLDSSDWPDFSVVSEALVAANDGKAVQGLNSKLYNALRMESSEMLEFFQQLDHNGAIREVE
jgi:hypothetical protein